LIKEEEEKEKKKEKINNFGNLNPFKSILPSFFYANQVKKGLNWGKI